MLQPQAPVGTSLQWIRGGPNLVYSWKLSDTVMCGKFPTITMQCDDFQNQQRYHRQGPLELYRWNLGDYAKALRWVLANPN